MQPPPTGLGGQSGGWGQDTDSAPPPHIPLYSLTGKGRLLTTGRASREVAGCAEAEEVQAVTRSSHSRGQGPFQNHTPHRPSPFLLRVSTPWEKRLVSAHTHPLLNSPYPPHQAVRASRRHLPETVLPLPSRTSQPRGQTDLEKGYSFPHPQGNLWQLTNACPPSLSLSCCEMGIRVNSAGRPNMLVRAQV